MSRTCKWKWGSRGSRDIPEVGNVRESSFGLLWIQSAWVKFWTFYLLVVSGKILNTFVTQFLHRKNNDRTIGPTSLSCFSDEMNHLYPKHLEQCLPPNNHHILCYDQIFPSHSWGDMVDAGCSWVLETCWTCVRSGCATTYQELLLTTCHSTSLSLRFLCCKP